MAFESITVSFSEKERQYDRGSKWVTLEQVYKSNSNEDASLGDLAQMLALAGIGQSSYGYLEQVCPYAVTNGDVITVSLDFFVWPSAVDLPYTLKSDIGTILPGVLVEEDRSFDVPFNNTYHSEMPFLFNGTLTPEMPFIDQDGSLMGTPNLTTVDATVVLDETTTSVYRAEGKATGFRHTIEMTLVKALQPEEIGAHTDTRLLVSGQSIIASAGYEINSFPLIFTDTAQEEDWKIQFITDTEFNLLDAASNLIAQGDTDTDLVTSQFTMLSDGWDGTNKASDELNITTVKADGIDNTGYKIENLQNNITVTWTDEEGEVQTDIMELEIPQCVQDLLTLCPDGKPKWWIACLGRTCGGDQYIVKYSTCDGSSLQEYWKRGHSGI